MITWKKRNHSPEQDRAILQPIWVYARKAATPAPTTPANNTLAAFDTAPELLPEAVEAEELAAEADALLLDRSVNNPSIPNFYLLGTGSS